MQPVLHPTPQAALHRCRMITDGNSHCRRTALPAPDVSDGLISEAMLPQIRAVAAMIAAGRHDFGGKSPAVFTEEADFFAARILVLGVRVFHLDITLMPMLNLANRRAQAFARLHGIAFTPAQMRMSLHARRPDNLLIIETEHAATHSGNIAADTLAFAAALPRLPL